MTTQEYTPKYAPETTIYFTWHPDQAQTFNQPGIPDEIEIINIKINNATIPTWLYDHLVETYGFQQEILERGRTNETI